VDGPSGNRSLSDRAVRLGDSRARPDEAGGAVETRCSACPDEEVRSRRRGF
jgi:hypothetical protein